MRVKENIFDMTKHIFLEKSIQAVEGTVNSSRQLRNSFLDEIKKLSHAKTSEFEKNIDLHEEIICFEIRIIRRALELTGGSQIQAAKLLSLKPSTLNAKIKRYKVRLGSPAFRFVAER